MRWLTSRLGLSGSAPWATRMAANLQKAGYRLVVHDLQRQAASHHLQAGAIWAETPKALAEQCDVIFSSLPEPPDVEAVALGPDGLLAGMQEGRGVFRSLDQFAERREDAACSLRGEGRAHARRAGERRPAGRGLGQARDLGRRREGGVRRAQGGARRDRRPGGLHRPDRRRDGRQAGAQHVRLRHRVRARRDVHAGREGRRRAARAVGRGAPGRGRAALHLRRAGRSVPAGQHTIRRPSRSSSRTRTCRSPTHWAASSACRCACATSRSPR